MIALGGCNNAALFQCAFPPVCISSGSMGTPLPVSALHHKIANGRKCLLYDAKNSATTGCFLLTGPQMLSLPSVPLN